MIAYLVLLLAALSRFVPHWMHHDGVNFTAVGAGLLFFGSRQPRSRILMAVLVMALTDVYLTHRVYHFPFHIRAYLVTWAWYGAVALLGSNLLGRPTVLRIAAAIFSSATSFFLLSNFMVWAAGGLYPHSAHGLMSCYAAALPFYRNDLISTMELSALLFGIPALAFWLRSADPAAEPASVPRAA